MKITNQTIIDTARRQREADMNGLSPRPWRRQHRRPAVPAWLVALPAAAVAGFLFGLSVRQPDGDATPLTAKADTIYITREVPVAQRPDTVVRYVERPRRASRQVASRQAEPPATGRSVAEDNIDYSMLVMR